MDTFLRIQQKNINSYAHDLVTSQVDLRPSADPANDKDYLKVRHVYTAYYVSCAFVNRIVMTAQADVHAQCS